MQWAPEGTEVYVTASNSVNTVNIKFLYVKQGIFLFEYTGWIR